MGLGSNVTQVTFDLSSYYSSLLLVYVIFDSIDNYLDGLKIVPVGFMRSISVCYDLSDI
jgi:hypothetical protein